MNTEAISIDYHERQKVSVFSSVWTSVNGFWTTIATHAANRRAERDLRAMDARLLKDIGIDRSEIMSVVYTPSRERTVSYDSF